MRGWSNNGKGGLGCWGLGRLGRLGLAWALAATLTFYDESVDPRATLKTVDHERRAPFFHVWMKGKSVESLRAHRNAELREKSFVEISSTTSIDLN